MIRYYADYAPYLVLALMIVCGIAFLEGVDDALDHETRLTGYCATQGASETLCTR